MSVEQVIERFVQERQPSSNGNAEINPDESLFDLGILDSLAFIQLITLIEKEFNITIGDDEVVPENFDTINHIKTFIERKKEIS